MTTNLNSYQDFANDFKKCRNHEAGRPLKGWCRLYQEGEDYVVKLVGWKSSNRPLFRVSPDNVLTFTAPVEEMLGFKQTLVGSLWRLIPFCMERKRKDIYVVAGVNDPKFQTAGHNAHYHDWSKVKKDGAEYFNGIQFDLLTGVCLNTQPNMMDTVKTDVRKAWLRDVKRFKKGLKARAKVGALDGFIKQVGIDKQKNGASYWSWKQGLDKWDSPEITQLVLESMRTEQYPPELLHLIVATVDIGWQPAAITNDMVFNNVDKVFNTHSIHFRKAYGVFGDTIHVKV